MGDQTTETIRVIEVGQGRHAFRSSEALMVSSILRSFDDVIHG